MEGETKQRIIQEYVPGKQVTLAHIIANPDEVIEDNKNKDTLFFIGKLDKNNLNIVIKLNTTNRRTS